MGNNYSNTFLEEQEQENKNVSSTVIKEDDNLTNCEYIYLVNYNNDYYFSKNNEDIIDLVSNIKQQYVNYAIKSWNVYNYYIYEKVNNKCQKLDLDDNSIESVLNSSNISSFENNTDMKEVYSLDVTKSIKHIILHVETTIERLRIYRVYNLSNIFERESESEFEPESDSERQDDNVSLNKEEINKDETTEGNTYTEENKKIN
jgi:hypothetical protein